MTRFTLSTSKAEAETIVRQWIDACLLRQEVLLALPKLAASPSSSQTKIEQLGREDAAELDALLRFADRKHADDEKAQIPGRSAQSAISILSIRKLAAWPT